MHLLGRLGGFRVGLSGIFRLRRITRAFPPRPFNLIRREVELDFVTSVKSLHTTGIKMEGIEGESKCRQNYHIDCEALVNKQINMELYASYVYLSMAYYFDREDVAFPGIKQFFKKSSDEERDHAQKFLAYQNKRGGRVLLQQIANPTKDDWESPLTAMTAALELEKKVNNTLLELHKMATKHGDANLTDFLEREFLDEQVEAAKELSGYITQLTRVGKGLGEYIFDQKLME